MHFFRGLLLRHKLTLIIMTTTGLVLALSLFAFIANEIFFYRHDLMDELASLAEIIARDNALAVVLDDREAAEDILLFIELGAQYYRRETFPGRRTAPRRL